MDFTQYLSSLIFVLGLIALIAWAVRYFFFSGKAFGQLGENQKISIKEIKSLDTKRRLIRVNWDEEEFLILTGVQSEQILSKAQLRAKEQHET